jgi:DNA-binding response OmpR family regulator
MLTGRGETIDHILGLEMGADYYMTKPYHQRQLLATVKAVLRRPSAQIAEKQPPSPSKTRFAGWKLDLLSRTLLSPSGEEVPLTAADFELLVTFVKNPNEVLSRDQLRNHEAGPCGRMVDVQIGRLRRKIEDHPRRPALIKTARDGGYIFTPLVEWI